MSGVENDGGKTGPERVQGEDRILVSILRLVDILSSCLHSLPQNFCADL